MGNRLKPFPLCSRNRFAASGASACLERSLRSRRNGVKKEAWPVTATPLLWERPTSGAGWGGQSRGAVFVGVRRGNAGVRAGDAIPLTQPAPQVDAPAPFATERQVRKLRRTGPTHRPLADRAACLLHRPRCPPSFVHFPNSSPPGQSALPVVAALPLEPPLPPALPAGLAAPFAPPSALPASPSAFGLAADSSALAPALYDSLR